MTPPGGDQVYKDANAEAVVRFPSPQVLATVVTGEVRTPLVHWYIRLFHGFLDTATHRVDIFHDWGGVTGASPDARKAFTDWVNSRGDRNRVAIRHAHTLAESTLVYLALGAVNAFNPNGYATAYRNRETFERERARVLLSPSTERIDRTVKGG
jgi:hypothetical protein